MLAILPASVASSAADSLSLPLRLSLLLLLFSLLTPQLSEALFSSVLLCSSAAAIHSETVLTSNPAPSSKFLLPRVATCGS